MNNSNKNSESLSIDPDQIKWLNQLVREGEGLHLEFKLKATYPDKLVHEIIAFANTKGGTLLIGVDDDGRMAGVKYPEEESLSVVRSLIKHCRPRIRVNYYYVRLTSKKWIVVFEVSESKRKPIKFLEGRNKLIHYIRFEDKSVQATPEAAAILKLRSSKTDVSFLYGDMENKILKAIEVKSPSTLAELCRATGISEKQLSPRLVKLAATHVVGWRPMDKHDIFFSVTA